MQRIAIYDLDRTITRLPTWTPFLLSSALRTAPWRLLLVPVAMAAGILHKLGVLNRDRIKEVMHALMLGRTNTPQRLAALADSFAARTMKNNIRSGAGPRIAADRECGYRIVMATAANRFYAGVIAKRLGIGDVIATESARMPGGVISNHLAGANVYGPAKRAAIEAWLESEGIARTAAHIRVYSDHVSDEPSLMLADEPFAVNPHGPLRRLALERSWPLLNWRRADTPDNGPADG